jgi:uncharacterized protein YpbB
LYAIEYNGNTWKEAVGAYFKAVLVFFLQGLKKVRKLQCTETFVPVTRFYCVKILEELV